jgi:hypothetical protein
LIQAILKIKNPSKKKALINLKDLTGRKKKSGRDLLSHTLECSTIGDEELDF